MTGDAVTGPDVPTEVYAALRAAADLAPTGPPPLEGDARAALPDWWDRNAESDEVTYQAYERLHEWAIATGQPAAVTAAVADAAVLRRKAAEQCRREAARAREEGER